MTLKTKNCLSSFIFFACPKKTKQKKRPFLQRNFLSSVETCIQYLKSFQGFKNKRYSILILKQEVHWKNYFKCLSSLFILVRSPCENDVKNEKLFEFIHFLCLSKENETKEKTLLAKEFSLFGRNQHPIPKIFPRLQDFKRYSILILKQEVHWKKLFQMLSSLFILVRSLCENDVKNEKLFEFIHFLCLSKENETKEKTLLAKEFSLFGRNQHPIPKIFPRLQDFKRYSILILKQEAHWKKYF